ncbi:MAG: hypothetical protein Q7T71_11445, partial [Herbiconiux sp.]|nr:hypothetical protein [Herbiconiux sp.]
MFVATAACALIAVPASAFAATPADLEVVVQRAKAVERPFPNVITLTVKNKGTTAYDASDTAGGGNPVFVGFTGLTSQFSGDFRSNHGWTCGRFFGANGSCTLDHVIPAGGSSLPIEIEILASNEAREGAATFEESVELTAEAPAAVAGAAGRIEIAPSGELPLVIPPSIVGSDDRSVKL